MYLYYDDYDHKLVMYFIVFFPQPRTILWLPLKIREKGPEFFIFLIIRSSVFVL